MKKISYKLKPIIVSAFTLLNVNAMAQQQSEQDDHPPATKTELSASMGTIIAGEAMAGKNAIQTFEVMTSPNITLQANKFTACISASPTVLATDKSIILCFLDLNAKLNFKLNNADISLTAGKIKTMSDIGSTSIGGSVSTNDMLIGNENIHGTLEKAALASYKTNKWSIDAGYSITPDEQHPDMLDFGNFKNGQAVFIGTLTPNNNFKIRALATSDFFQKYLVHISAIFQHGKFTAAAEYITNDSQSHLAVLSAKHELKNQFSLFFQTIVKTLQNAAPYAECSISISHKNGIFTALGAHYRDGKTTPSIKVGFLTSFQVFNTKQK